jgi:hypothetical protein
MIHAYLVEFAQLINSLVANQRLAHKEHQIWGVHFDELFPTVYNTHTHN